MLWDDNNIKILQKLWDKGLSTTEIAKKMNVSKNSVVGKVHRLCLKARPSPIKKKENELAEEQEVITVEQVTAEEEIKEDVLIEETKVAPAEKSDEKEIVSAKKDKPKKEQEKASKKAKYVKLVELDSHTCRWPIGDPRDEDFCFCGKKVRAGQTYCDEHSQVAYVKALARK